MSPFPRPFAGRRRGWETRLTKTWLYRDTLHGAVYEEPPLLLALHAEAARLMAASLPEDLERREFAGKTYYYIEAAQDMAEVPRLTLLSGFDPLLASYADRTLCLPEEYKIQKFSSFQGFSCAKIVFPVPFHPPLTRQALSQNDRSRPHETAASRRIVFAFRH